MPKSIWDFCYIDSTLQNKIDELSSNQTKLNINNNLDINNIKQNNNNDLINSTYATNNDSILKLQYSIIETEQICTKSIHKIQDLLNLLTQIEESYDDVMNRTNTLMVTKIVSYL